MATSVEQIDLTKSGQICEFSGSSDADIANAKTFWKSILLMPPAESRLVSGDIRQRLKIAEISPNVVNLTQEPVEYPPKLRQFLAQASQQEEMERRQQYDEVNDRRQQQRDLLHHQREIRIQKEMMSGNRHPTQSQGNAGQGDESAINVREDSWQEDEDPTQCMKELDEFDRKLRDASA